EVERLTKAMKDPKFMEMFMDYAKEISNPAMKKDLEKHLKRMEAGGNKEFSMEGKELLIPYSDFCIKTRNKNTGHKVFINLCHSEKVAKPIAIQDPFRGGTQWEIPYSLGPAQDDKDKIGKECEVHDFIVGTETHQRAKDDKRFKQFLVQTAIEAIEKQRGLQLDPRYSLPQLKYKGINGTKDTRMFTIPKEKPTEENTTSAHEVVNDEDVLFPTGWHEEVEPKCEVIYRNHVNYGDYWEDNVNLIPEENIPKEILLRIHLPNVMDALDILVDLDERQVMLRVPGQYRLKVI
ncbi:hypothetical protein BDL97_10G039000, partial [Sphagnum fallax]